MRISSPKYTQIPNELMDQWLPSLGEVELKVLLVIMRKTLGWHKSRAQVSLSQLEKITGSLRQSILNATNSLILKGLIKKIVDGDLGFQSTYYELVIHDDSNNSCQYDSHTTPPCSKNTPPSVNPVPPSHIGIKESIKERVVAPSENFKKISNEKKEFCKSDFQRIGLKKNWTEEEIDEAWEIFEKRKGLVDDPFAYFEGIIGKKRNKAHLIELKEKKQCQNINLQETLQEKQEKQKSKSSGHDTPMRALAAFWEEQKSKRKSCFS